MVLWNYNDFASYIDLKNINLAVIGIDIFKFRECTRAK